MPGVLSLDTPYQMSKKYLKMSIIKFEMIKMSRNKIKMSKSNVKMSKNNFEMSKIENMYCSPYFVTFKKN